MKKLIFIISLLNINMHGSIGVGDFIIGPDSSDSDGKENSGQGSASTSFVAGQSTDSYISSLKAKIIELEKEKAELEVEKKCQEEANQQFYTYWCNENAKFEKVQNEFQTLQLYHCVRKAILDKIVGTNGAQNGASTSMQIDAENHNELVINEGVLQRNFVRFLLQEFDHYSVRFSKISVGPNVHYEQNAIFNAIENILVIDPPDHQFDRVHFKLHDLALVENKLLKLLNKSNVQSPRSPQSPYGNFLFDKKGRIWKLWNAATMANYHLRLMGPIAGHGKHSERYGSTGQQYDELELVKVDPGTI